MTPNQLIIIFIILIIKTSLVSLVSVDLECEFKEKNNLEYVPGNQYTCTLKTDYLDIKNEATIGKINGNHANGKNHTNVTALSATDLKLFRIPKLFGILTELELIYITKSNMRQLERDDLLGYKATLKHLAVTNSKLDIINENFFSGFSLLETINFKDNQIIYIAENAFVEPSAPKRIYLDGCDCKDKDGVDIMNCQNPTSCLEFKTKFPNSTCKAPTLGMLKVCQKSKVELDYVINECNENYQKLEGLFININDQLSSIKENYTIAENTISNLKTEIDNLNSKIKELETESEKCLDVNGTCRYTIDANYGYSCIAHNIKVKSSQDVITWQGTQSINLTNRDVQGLIIRDLEVDVVPTKLSTSFTSLKNLIINNCGLKKLSKVDFAGLDGLKVLQLSGNQITSIDSGTFSAISGLTELNLSKNQLTSIKSNMLSATVVIKKFNAAENKITSIDASLIWRLKSADLIDISGNTKCNQKYDKSAGNKFLTFYSEVLTKC